MSLKAFAIVGTDSTRCGVHLNKINELGAISPSMSDFVSGHPLW